MNLTITIFFFIVQVELKRLEIQTKFYEDEFHNSYSFIISIRVTTIGKLKKEKETVRIGI